MQLTISIAYSPVVGGVFSFDGFSLWSSPVELINPLLLHIHAKRFRKKFKNSSFLTEDLFLQSILMVLRMSRSKKFQKFSGF
jgi:hypothetical protein